MAIQIKDLPESIELDREAMSTIYGGSKTPLVAGLDLRKRRRCENNTLIFFPEKDLKHRQK